MIRRLGRALFLLWLGIGCSGGAPPPKGGAGGVGGTGGDGGSDDAGPRRDTFGYDGRLAWSMSMDAIFTWDLPTSELHYRAYAQVEEVDRFHSPALSANGTTLVYVTENRGLPSDTQVRVISLGTGATQLYPSEDSPTNPSVSANGNRIAVVTDKGAEVWDRAANQTFSITSEGYLAAYLPVISADGAELLVIGQDKNIKLDVYLAEATPGSSFRRLYVFHPELLEVPRRPLQASGDLRWVVFLGKLAHESFPGERAPFLLDTATGTVRRLSAIPAQDGHEDPVDFVIWNSVAISRDGSRPAFAVDSSIGSYVFTAPRGDPSEVSVVRSGSHRFEAVALSSDGTQVAFTQDEDELWISRIDGSDPRLISGPDESRVAAIQMTLTF